MLVDFLVISRINYALPAWGPSLSGSLIQRVQSLLNWGGRITAASLRKFDHVSAHQTRLRWLPVTSMIKYCSLCAIHQHYGDPNCMLLDPPFVFGLQHCYHTRTAEQFVHVNRCRSSATQRSFRLAAAKWWNDLLESVVTSSTFSSDVYYHFLNNV